MDRPDDGLPLPTLPAAPGRGDALLTALWDRQLDGWLRGEPVRVEALLEEHPALLADGRAIDLIANEIALRQAGGEAPDWDEYRRRFPRLAGRLRLRFTAPEALPKESPRVPAEDPFAAAFAPSAANDRRTDDGGRKSANSSASRGDKARAARETVPGYEVLGELGRGGMGVVYKARQVALNRVVALKMILGGAHAGPEDLARFRTEAEAVAQLKHANIVQVYDIGECDGKPFFSLEFVEGGSLDRKLNRKAQKPKEAAALVETLARAMHSAHQKGVIHRDLKPANVLLTPDGMPKITDFGLAKRLEDDRGQTHSGSVMGTPSYMAPEQAAGRVQDMGPATDVYSLGAILYDALTGRPPFKGATVVDTLAQVRNDEPLPPSRLQPRVPRDLETICLKCLQKSPRKRYGSAAELAEDLRRFQAGEPILARPMGRAEWLWRWCRRNPVAAGLLLTVTLGSAFGMWHLSQLSEALVRSTALESAAQQTETFDRLNDYYSDDVAGPAKNAGVPVTHAYASTPGSIPAPATLNIDLGDYISAHSARGMHVRLYSDLPFRSRKDGGVRDDFERDALDRLRESPDEPYYRFEEMDGRPVLRYATARVMKQSCVDCHNSHPESPRMDWKVGEVRGVLEVIRPLDRDEERTRQGLGGTFGLVGGVSAGLLLLSSLILLVGNWRKRRPDVPLLAGKQ
jgi:predicted Ser/Thr protein kinase